MSADRLRDRVHWGLNRVANILGCSTDVYRPNGMSEPLERSNRYIRLNAAFSRVDGNFKLAVGYGIPVWQGYFDAAYTRVGDYLVQGERIWFIAAQDSLLPILCVRTTRVISISRQLTPAMSDVHDPSNYHSTMDVLSNWPASVLGTGTEGKPSAQLPGDTPVPNSTVLLPAIHNQTVLPADIVTDEFNTRSIVIAAELSSLGWRLNTRVATT
jgi:hypothetical protein